VQINMGFLKDKGEGEKRGGGKRNIPGHHHLAVRERRG